jgi:hypothetical protein
MDYYIYNTDVKYLKGKTQGRFRKLIDGNFAASGGPRHYGENFNKPKINDVLLMYVNKIGKCRSNGMVIPTLPHCITLWKK